MPGGTGLVTLDHLSASTHTMAIPVMVVTREHGPLDGEGGRGSGCHCLREEARGPRDEAPRSDHRLQGRGRHGGSFRAAPRRGAFDRAPDQQVWEAEASGGEDLGDHSRKGEIAEVPTPAVPDEEPRPAPRARGLRRPPPSRRPQAAARRCSRAAARRPRGEAPPPHHAPAVPGPGVAVHPAAPSPGSSHGGTSPSCSRP
jgi:hypothetical protein